MIANWELDYFDTIQSILIKPESLSGHSDTITRSIHGTQIRVPMDQGFPVMVCRPIFPKIAIEEMMFFLRGESNTETLRAKGIHIWDGNTNREFLDKRGLTYLDEWDMGHGYGVQMRRFGEDQRRYADQIEDLVADIIRSPESRRHLVTHWNPLNLDKTALPPCHVMHQYLFNGHNMDCVMTMRSCDMVYGLPYNIIGYAFLMHWLAFVINARSGQRYVPRELIINIGDAHIYDNQVEYIEAVMANALDMVGHNGHSMAYPEIQLVCYPGEEYNMRYGQQIIVKGGKHLPEPTGVKKPPMAA